MTEPLSLLAAAAAVRPARADDTDAILALLGGAGLPLVGVTPAAMGHFLVAEHDGRVVGCAGLERHGPHGMLRSVATAPAVRGAGLGTALVARALAASADRGDADVWLVTDRAEPWFTRVGFRVLQRKALPDALEGVIDHHGACPTTAVLMRRVTPPPVPVLVLCTGNSARSQIGEALLATLGRGVVRAGSAGSRPAPRVNPMAVRVLGEHGIAWDGGTPKTIDAVLDDGWQVVLTVCDNAKEACPIFPGAPRMAHWGMPDPADEEDDRARHAAFTAVHEALRPSVRTLVDLLARRAEHGDLPERAVLTSLAPALTTFVPPTDPR